jgi:hypothetical protein
MKLLRSRLIRSLGLATSLFTLSSCEIFGAEECSLARCLSLVSVTTTDTSGQPLTTISGTAKLGGATMTIRCPDESSFLCFSSGFKLQNPADLSEAIELDIHDDGGRVFQGTIQPQYKRDDEDDAPCAQDCVQGTAAVTLQ